MIAFYTTKDIPGRNVFTDQRVTLMVEEEELFVQNRVKYHSQPAGIIVAESLDLAHKAAGLVTIVYGKSINESDRPILADLTAVLASAEVDRITKSVGIEAHVVSEGS